VCISVHDSDNVYHVSVAYECVGKRHACVVI